jgi:nucleoside-triphosphatase
MSIYLFSRPVHSGKTTTLLQWCSRQNNIRGVLMPDINGSRKILNIKTKEIFDIECTDAGNSKEPLTSVGRFSFYTAAFEKANLILLDALTQNTDWLVIDEAGKLELDGKGFYNSIAKAIDLYNNETRAGNLLITVRDSLCNDVISSFNISNYIIVSKLEDLPG